MIKDDDPYYGEVPELKGVWSSGKTLEQCRRNLEEVIEGWILVRISQGKEIPELRDKKISLPKEVPVV